MSSLLRIPPITVEQYEQFEGHPKLRDELIDGTIVLSPQPKPLHQQVSKNIMRALEKALQGQPYTAQQNSNLKFLAANSMPAPDVFITSKETWNRACVEDRYVSEPPVLVVEVLSPAKQKKTAADKVRLYLNCGVPEIWLVHPRKHLLEYFVPNGSGLAGERRRLPSPLTGEIEVAEFFAQER